MDLSKVSKKEHFLQGKRIIVAGGGIAGSAFVASLLKLWDPTVELPSINIYERDPEDVTLQREGYSVSLVNNKIHGGLNALAKCDLLDEALAASTSGQEGGAFKIWNAQWDELMSFQQKTTRGDTRSVRIQRKSLRRVLHAGCGRAIINWDTQCVSARHLEYGRVAVEVVQGGTRAREETCDLLVIADGANSKLRSSLQPQEKLNYTGAVLRGGLSHFPEGLPKPIDRDWGFMLSSNGVSCFWSPSDEHNAMWALGHLEDQISSSHTEDKQAVIDRALDLGSSLEEPFQTIVHRTDPSTVMCLNAKDKMPFRHDSLEGPIIFIGDSNHALSPFAGYGANLALVDGWDLAQQLCQGRTLEQAVAAYDHMSVPRATKLVKDSRRRLRQGHSTGFRYWIFLTVLWFMRIFRRLLESG